MAEKAVDTVLAVVARSTYQTVDADGNRTTIYAGKGKDSEVTVPRHHLVTFAGVLVEKSKFSAEKEQVDAERMQAPTPPGEGAKSNAPEETEAPPNRKRP